MTIFLSYSRGDAQQADDWVANLEQHGYRVWVDRVGIRGGQQWMATIVRAIEEAQAVILLLSPNSAQSMRWRIKRETNDEIRQRFVDVTVPQAEAIGLKVPDPELKWSEAKGGYDFGPIDLAEFHAVVRGEGPVAKERIKARVDAWEAGAWVREAALAHAEKRRTKAEAA